MRRRFIDFHVSVKADSIRELIKHVKHLGFSAIVVPFTVSSEIKTVFKENGLSIYVKKEIEPAGSKDLYKKIRKINEYDVLTVTCNSVKIARNSTRLKNVDSLYFPLDSLKIFDKAQANVMQQNKKILELRFRDIIEGYFKYNWRIFKVLEKVLSLALSKDIPIILGSGAKKIEELKSPRDMISIFMVLGIKYEDAVNTVSENPHRLLLREDRTQVVEKL